MTASKEAAQTHILSVLVENRSGVLVRVAGLFARRGYNIDSLSVAVTQDPEISRMTIVVSGDDLVLEQVKKQLNKLIDVIKVVDLSGEESIEREMALIKVSAPNDTKAEIMRIVDIFRGKIVDVGTGTLTIEVTGSNDKIRAIEKLLRPFGIKEMARAGRIGLIRGNKES